MISVLLLLAMILSAVPAALAEDAQLGYLVINNNTVNRVVNFRRQPNTNDNTNFPIARLPEFWVVQIQESVQVGSTKWYKIIANVNVEDKYTPDYKTGYVMASYVRIMTDAERAAYLQTGEFLPEGQLPGPDFSPTQAPYEPISLSTVAPVNIPDLAGVISTYVLTTKSGVNLRQTPNGSIMNASSLIESGRVLSCYRIFSPDEYDSYAWALVQYNGMTGFIRGDCFVECDVNGNVKQPAAPTAAPVVTSMPVPMSTVDVGFISGVTQGVVTANDVFLRKTMTTNGDYLAKLPAGWTMTVLSSHKSNGITWYRVQGGIPTDPNGVHTGYIHGGYFALTGAIQPTATAAPWYVPTGLPTVAPTAIVNGDSNFALVLVDGVNMRQTPGGATVSVLPANTVVTVLTKPTSFTANDWYFIQYNGFMGYLPATSVRVLSTSELDNGYPPVIVTAAPGTATAVPAPVVTTLPAGIKGYVKLIKDKVNVRQAPAGTILTGTDKSKLKVGTVIAYMDGPTQKIDGYEWVLISYNGLTGYIRSDCYAFCDEAGAIIVAPTATPLVNPTFVPGGTQGYIKLLKGGVNLRRAPGGETIAQLAKGTILPYFNMAKQNSATLETWYEVYSVQKGTFGYILSTMAEPCDAQGNPVTPALPTASPATVIGYVATNISSVWLRSNPSADSATIGQVKAKGTVLPQIGPVVKNGYDWDPVETKEGLRGYLRGDCVFSLAEWQLEEYQRTGKIATPTPGPATPRPGNSSYIITTFDKVYIRQTPSTKAAALGQMAIGSVLRFTGTQTVGKVLWYQVLYNNQAGWLHGDYARVLTNAEYDNMYATPSPVPGSTTVPPAAPVLEDLSDMAVTLLDKVNIRAKGAMNGKEIGMVDRAGTKLTYLGKYTVPTKDNNFYWFYIRYGNVSGWMRGDCVRVLTVAEKAAQNQPTVTVSPSQTATYRTLYKNSSGDDVYALQYRLSQLGYLAADQVNGYYLTSTENAVISFQRAYGLTVDGVAGSMTQHALFGTTDPTVTSAPGSPGVPQYADGSSVTVTLYPVEKSDWFTGDIQNVWPNGSVAILTDVYTGISFKAQRLYGGNHADCEPVDTSDTAAICAIYGVSRPQEIEDREQELQSYRRRPTWVTVGGRTFCASVYGIPHNYSGDRIPNNNYTGQFCVHFTNSRTHTTNIVDPDASYNNYFGAQSAIQYAYEHSISGQK